MRRMATTRRRPLVSLSEVVVWTAFTALCVAVLLALCVVLVVAWP